MTSINLLDFFMSNCLITNVQNAKCQDLRIASLQHFWPRLDSIFVASKISSSVRALLKTDSTHKIADTFIMIFENIRVCHH